MTKFSTSLLVTLLTLLAPAVLFVNASTDARVCQQCTNLSSAKAIAAQQAPALNCTTNGRVFFGPGMQCTSTAKDLILVNPITDQVFALKVYHRNTPPWPVVVDTMNLSADKKYALQEASKRLREFRQDVAQATITYQVNGTQTALSAIDANNNNKVSTNNSTSSCPVGTALEMLSRPGFEEAARVRAQAAVEFGLDRLKGYDSNFLVRTLSNGNFGFTYKGFQFNLGFDQNHNPITLVEEYPISEVSNLIYGDALVFDIAVIVRPSDNNAPRVRISLNDVSQIAGMQISLANGNHTITNECVKSRLERWARNNVKVTNTTSPAGGGGGLPEVLPGLTPPTTGYSCTTITWQQASMHHPKVYTWQYCS
jgi:hypothetical protein